MTSRSSRAALANLGRVVGEIREAAPPSRGIVEASGDLLRGLCDDVEALLLAMDSQELIDTGALVDRDVYWGCADAACPECPATIGGLTPEDFYEVSSCDVAQTFDLLRRQRALDARGAR